MQLSHFLQDPKTRHPIYDLQLPFSDYITQCRKIIATTRLDLTSQNREKIINDISPFELRPEHSNGKGVLLIHGLLDTPAQMRDVAMQLQEKGYLVRAILLPGHATVPGDLLSVTYQDWNQALQYGIASFNNEIDQLYLIGFSTGASLALHHVLYDDKIAGVALISPAIRIYTRFDFSANWHRIISWAWERAKWMHVSEENDYQKYQSMPFNAAYQIYTLTQILKKASLKHTPQCPLFFAVSTADTTVSAHASIAYFQKHLKPENRLLLYTREQTHQDIPNTIVRSSIYPELHIHDFSHIALPIAPDNAHYGKRGDSCYASRIDTKTPMIYGSYNRLENSIYRFLYNNGLTQFQRKRLSYNPDFDFMMAEIGKFLSIELK